MLSRRGHKKLTLTLLRSKGFCCEGGTWGEVEARGLGGAAWLHAVPNLKRKVIDRRCCAPVRHARVCTTQSAVHFEPNG